jgi:phospholipid/cholesterol/gamma-HCH transport system substrate-binding protein
MDVSKAEKVRLGMFLLISSGLLAIVIFSMIGQRLFIKKVAYFTRLDESVSGLELGTPVKQNGVEVGNISVISTDSSDIKRSIVRFEVKQGTPMKADMTASMGSYGITGLKYIEITGGSYSAADVPIGGEVKSELSILGKLTLRADSIALKVDHLLGNIIGITESQNKVHIDKLIKSSANLSAGMDSLTQDIVSIHPGKRIENILSQLELATKEVKTKIRDAEIVETVHEYRNAAAGMTGVTQKLDLTLLRVQEDLGQSMSNLKETMKNMNTFSRQIKENPSILLRGEDKQERRK